MRRGLKLRQNETPNEFLNGCLTAKGFEGTDISLLTGLEWQRYALYCQIRKGLSKKYPKPKEGREDKEDTLNISEARKDEKAPLFLKALTDTHDALEKVSILQNLATDYEKKAVRIYAHLTRNWPEHSAEFLKALMKADLYEIVESYFKILRKYGLSTYEEPYYFLSPKQKRDIIHEGEMLKRTTQIDDSEIQVSILEEFL